MLNITEKQDGKILEVTMSGKLNRDDFEHFGPLLEQSIEKHQKIRILAVMRDFHGWGFGAFWEDLRWELKHSRDIEYLAVIGEKKWQETLSKLCAPFTSAEVRYFDSYDLEKAREWIEHAGEAVAAV